MQYTQQQTKDIKLKFSNSYIPGGFNGKLGNCFRYEIKFPKVHKKEVVEKIK